MAVDLSLMLQLSGLNLREELEKTPPGHRLNLLHAADGVKVLHVVSVAVLLVLLTFLFQLSI